MVNPADALPLESRKVRDISYLPADAPMFDALNLFQVCHAAKSAGSNVRGLTNVVLLIVYLFAKLLSDFHCSNPVVYFL